MSKMSLTTFNTLLGSRWNELRHRAGEWRRRARLRHELTNLSDGGLRDIGVSRSEVDFESSKSFWQV
jgi:uncharacterized protein YjiS (DUF1127 family)